MSTFKTKNLYHLRISANSVLPLYVYLDPRHLSWMTDTVLQHVLSDLRPLIISKLTEEAHAYFGPGSGPQGAKKPTVSTHRGETYHFCYFFKKTEPYSLLIKKRHFVAVPVHKPNPAPPTIPNPPRPRKRVRKNDSLGRIEGAKKSKTKVTGKQKGKATEIHVDEDLMDEDEHSTAEPEPRRSKRQRKSVTVEYNEEGDTDNDSTEDEDEYVMDSDPPETAPQTQSDGEDDEIVMVKNEEREPSLRSQSRSQSQQPGPSFIDLEAEEEEMKPKPQLQLSFNGFTIFGRCLCVIVEPWPVIRAPAEPRAPQSSRMAANSRATSVIPDLASGRGQTPLFLPDTDDGGFTPAPTAEADRPPVPLFNHPPPDNNAQDDEDEGGMMLFSELLSATGGLRVDADDEDGFDGAILFGDADERKELS
ncbi:hypothetical protein BJ322DRAFT_1110714 [Thelephora terrestris]|uniref:Uncharacterized protein n=1 Tax=Thelephora terrestris TaxID=56493 RepID=A0A9P6L4E3_9AGAM|nr:hypothetical protein BJ322DRAFT_1110714 [Thelephora terrestris]